jgi:molybdopterin-guanine dinucleotide biosynthesis protein B
MSNVPPVVCIGGSSKAGKITFLEKLIFEFKKRGYRVGTIKHHCDEFEVDWAGKDSWRHTQAGADAVCISAPQKIAIIKRIEKELPLEEVFPLINDVDIILAEGYKGENKPQIEVLAPDAEPAPFQEKIICIVGSPGGKSRVPCFDSGDASGVANLLEKMFLPRLVRSQRKGKNC